MQRVVKNTLFTTEHKSDMITQENAPTKRGEKLYWKQGDTFTTVYFRAYHPMPVAPHAVSVVHHTGEAIVSDFLIFTEKDRFQAQFRDELTALKGTYKSKRALATQYGWPYSRVLNVYKEAKEYGLL